MAKPETAPKPATKPATKPTGWLDSSWTYPLLAFAVLILGLIYVNVDKADDNPDVAPLEDTISEHPLTDADMPAFGDAVGRAWEELDVDRSTLPARLGEPGQSVYVAFRAGGKRIEDVWVHVDQLPNGGTMWDVLLEALKVGRAKVGDQRSTITRLEIDLTHSYRALVYTDKDQLAQIRDEDRMAKVPRHHGVRGMRVRNGDRNSMWAPTRQIANNRTNRKLLDELREKWGLSEEEFGQSEFNTFEADQVLVRLDAKPTEAVLMFRGNRLVDIADVDQAATEKLATGMKDWLVNNLHEDGRLSYTQYPSSGKEELKSNNMIRQWMATNAMVRWAHDRSDTALFDLAEKNIDYNVAHFYSQDGELGRINEGDKVKLGAVALAGMAMYTHPKREKWLTQVTGIRKMVDHLWHEDGSFDCFYAGGESGAQYNFYPGEALLFWATIYQEEKDAEILRKYKLSVPYFKAWHMDTSVENRRNPAFVPWHLQANYTLFASLGEDEAEFKQVLVDYSFELADWLVDVQQWTDEDGITYPDEKGRFYSPDHKYGVPHASATGVYIEGLIDAWQFARDTGDDARKEKYRVALIRGIRSMMQLQFVDDVDMFYIGDPSRIVGGIRTSEYKNDIRCDNVQHPLMGIVKILRMFEVGEYANAG